MIACTVDACDPVAGCTNMPDATRCDDGIACTTDRCDPVAGCANVADTGTCPAGQWCDTAVARACTPGATFTEVYAVVRARCGPCHLTNDRGGLDMRTQVLAYGELVGVTAECGGGLNTRVIAFDSRQSLLWRKVSGVDLCGARMPFGGDLPAADWALIASWIDSGALDN
jgi:hypothetical protein